MSGAPESSMGARGVAFPICWDSVEFGVISDVFNRSGTNFDSFWRLGDSLEI